MEMAGGDQYGDLPDLRRLLARAPHFPATQQRPSEPYFVHRSMAPLAPYNEAAFMVPGGLLRFGGGHDNHHHHFAAAAAAAAASASGSTTASGSAIYGVDEMDNGRWSLANFDGNNNSRWPRQETLTLLEIRSRLDSKFKEANQKGPLWNEVSRIMAEEHGYHRSGKKCREKFENLYKYYKKTKEGKAGRQDGKNYRFFRQLEALYGETSNQSSLSEANLLHQTQETQDQQKLMISESLSFSNATSDQLETSSSENNNNQDDLSAIAFMMKHSMGDHLENYKQKRDEKKGWKAKVKDLVELQMKKIIDSQDVWMERMLKTIEDREQERMLKEEEWRRQEAARFEKEHELWAKERAWVEARDASVMEVQKKFTGGKGLEVSSSAETHSQNTNRWAEDEVSSLIQLLKSLEPNFQKESNNRYSEEISLWEEIEAKMVSLGYERDANECKEKWENMQMQINMTNIAESHKRRKEDFRRPRNSHYFQQLDSYNYDEGQENNTDNNNDNCNSKQRDSPSNSYVGTSHQHLHDFTSFHIALNQGDDDQHHSLDRYGLKLSKVKNHQI